MYTAEQLELFKQHIAPGTVRSMLIGECLSKQLNATPIDKEGFDLNPHLEVLRIAHEVSDAVTAEGVECSDQDVMLYWLTMALFYGVHT